MRQVLLVYILFTVVFGIAIAYTIDYDDTFVDDGMYGEKRSTMSRLYEFLRNLKKIKPETIKDELLSGEETYRRSNDFLLDTSAHHSKSNWIADNIRRILEDKEILDIIQQKK